MSSEGLAYSERLIAPARGPAYGEGQLAHEPPAKVVETLERRTHWVIALAIFTPVAAAYGAILYGFYIAAGALF